MSDEDYKPMAFIMIGIFVISAILHIVYACNSTRNSELLDKNLAVYNVKTGVFELIDIKQEQK